MKTDELDRLVAAGKIREIDREVRFIVRRIVQPPERPDNPLPENIVGSTQLVSTRHCAIWCHTESSLLPITDVLGRQTLNLTHQCELQVSRLLDLPLHVEQQV
jgi:hypothetical protein